MFKPTEEQEAILHALQTTDRNLLIKAGPGCGKSATIIWLTSHVDKKKMGQVTCFGSDIRKELNEKLAANPKFSAVTFNSIAWSAVRKHLHKKHGVEPSFDQMKPNQSKYYAYAGELAEKTDKIPPEYRRGAAKTLANLLQMSMVTLTNPSDETVATDLFSRYSLLPKLEEGDEWLAEYLFEWAIQHVNPMKTWGEQQINKFDFTFTDQVYYTVMWNLKTWSTYYLFIDEAQDISALELKLLKKAVWNNGRVVVVGDPDQMIYSFKGTMPNSLGLVSSAFNCMELALTQTFRCKWKIVRLANQVQHSLRPAVTDGDGGSVKEITRSEVVSLAKPGDAIISRLSAPLISMCLEFLKRDIPATVLGSEIGISLNQMLDEVADMDGFKFSDIVTFIRDYTSRRTSAMDKKNEDEKQIEQFQDTAFALQELVERYTTGDNPARNMIALQKNISDLFTEKAGDPTMILLMTSHKSKGMEFGTVFMLEDKLPMTAEKEEWNVWFVTATRAKNQLYCVKQDDPRAKTPAWLEGFTDDAYPEGAVYEPLPEKELPAEQLTLAEAEETQTEKVPPVVEAVATEQTTQPLLLPDAPVEKPIKQEVVITKTETKLTGNLAEDLKQERLNKKREQVHTLLESMTTDQLDSLIKLIELVRDEKVTS